MRQEILAEHPVTSLGITVNGLPPAPSPRWNGYAPLWMGSAGAGTALVLSGRPGASVTPSSEPLVANSTYLIVIQMTHGQSFLENQPPPSGECAHRTAPCFI